MVSVRAVKVCIKGHAGRQCQVAMAVPTLVPIVLVVV